MVYLYRRARLPSGYSPPPPPLPFVSKTLFFTHNQTPHGDVHLHIYCLKLFSACVSDIPSSVQYGRGSPTCSTPIELRGFSIVPFHYGSFIKGSTRVNRRKKKALAPRRSKKKKKVLPCVLEKAPPLQPDFLRDDPHRRVPLSRRELSLRCLCICRVLMCVSHIYGLRLIVIIFLSRRLRTLSRREEPRRQAAV